MMEVNHQKEDAMADDAAKRWVSPYWSSSPAGPPNFPRVWVLNPGTAAAEVTVRWHEAVTGDVLEKETHTIDAGTIWLFVSGEPGGFGWLGISSDRPIVPWGTTPVSSGQDELGTRRWTSIVLRSYESKSSSSLESRQRPREDAADRGRVGAPADSVRAEAV
ncbi:hypothetical protein BH09ACT13_BH09ACT13_04090 [soil metagenome]